MEVFTVTFLMMNESLLYLYLSFVDVELSGSVCGTRQCVALDTTGLARSHMKARKQWRDVCEAPQVVAPSLS
jgi:hypothetical protein